MKKSSRIQLTVFLIFAAVAISAVALNFAPGSIVTAQVPTQIDSLDPIPAPDFKIEMLSGKTRALSDYKGKKPVVINFWGSWCGPCRHEAPFLAEVSQEYGEEVEFLGIAVNDSRGAAENFIRSYKITYENGLDETNIAATYGVRGTPTTFWVNKEGEIVDVWVGAIDKASLFDRVEKML